MYNEKKYIKKCLDWLSYIYKDDNEYDYDEIKRIISNYIRITIDEDLNNDDYYIIIELYNNEIDNEKTKAIELLEKYILPKILYNFLDME
jgi:hypothetical protein